MDIRKTLLVKSLRVTDSHSMSHSQQQTQATEFQDEEIRINANLPCLEVSSEKLRHILRSHKIRSLFALKALCINYFVNQNFE